MDVNSTTLNYLEIGQVKVEPGKVTTATFVAVALPRVVRSRIVDVLMRTISAEMIRQVP